MPFRMTNERITIAIITMIDRIDRMKYILLVFALFACSSSLVIIGTDFDASRISQIEKGNTTSK